MYALENENITNHPTSVCLSPVNTPRSTYHLDYHHYKMSTNEPPQHIKDQEATSQASAQSSPSTPSQPLGMEQLHHQQSQTTQSLHPVRSHSNLPEIERLKLESGPISPTPYSASSGGILKQLDQSTNASRLASRAPSRAPSVAGIGKTAAKPDYSEAKIVVAMVGLPARGKSYLSNKLMRYLKWLEYDVKVGSSIYN